MIQTRSCSRLGCNSATQSHSLKSVSRHTILWFRPQISWDISEQRGHRNQRTPVDTDIGTGDRLLLVYRCLYLPLSITTCHLTSVFLCFFAGLGIDAENQLWLYPVRESKLKFVVPWGVGTLRFRSKSFVLICHTW